MDYSDYTDSEKDEVLRNFIETYEALPELWNPTHKYYLHKTGKNIALHKLLDIYIKIKPEAVIADVKKKLNALRTNYRKELKKMLTSKRSGNSADQVYEPRSWVFFALKFLDKFEQPVQEKEQQMAHDDGRQDEPLKGQSSAEETPTSSRSSILAQPPPRKSRVPGPVSKQNELLQKACTYLEQSNENEEQIPTIAKAWGESLTKLQSKQRLFAEKAINDILFEASQGTLHRYSVQINEDTLIESSSQSSFSTMHEASSQSSFLHF